MVNVRYAQYDDELYDQDYDDPRAVSDVKSYSRDTITVQPGRYSMFLPRCGYYDPFGDGRPCDAYASGAYVAADSNQAALMLCAHHTIKAAAEGDGPVYWLTRLPEGEVSV